MRAVQRDAAARDLHVRVTIGLQRVLDGFTGSENRGVELVVLANLDRAVTPVGRNHQAKLAALVGVGEMLLVVHRLVAPAIGDHPDLIEMRGVGVRGVEFTMRNAGSRAHVLNVAGLDDGPVAHAVLVSQRAFENIGDDFHVTMRMRGETATPGDAVVIHDPQGAELDMLRVVIIGERESEAAVEPTVVGMAALVAFADKNHESLLKDRKDNICYNDYCQEAHFGNVGRSVCRGG